MKIKLNLETRGKITAKLWTLLEQRYGVDSEIELNDLSSLHPTPFIELILALQIDLDEDMAIDLVKTLIPMLEAHEELALVSLKTIDAIDLYMAEKISEEDMLKAYYDARDAVSSADKNRIHIKAITSLCYAAGAVYADSSYKYSFYRTAISLASEVAYIMPEVAKEQAEIIKRYFSE